MVLKKFIKFVIPSILSMWIFALYTMVDGIFVSYGVGEYALAAVNLSMPFTIFIFSVGLLMATGASTLIAIFLGEGKSDRAHHVFNQNLVVLVVLGILISVVTYYNLESIALFLGAGPETLSYVKGYMGWISILAVFFIVSYNMEILVKTDGSPHIQMMGVFLCAISNIVLDYLFVIRLHMGVEGAAIATGIAQVASTCIFIFYFKFKGKHLTFRKFRFDLSIYKRIIPLGLSDSITELSAGLVIFLFNRIILSVIGNDGLISYTVISYVNTLALNSMAGIAQGIQPLVSYYYGSGKQSYCHKLLKYGLIASLLSGAFFLMLAEVFPQLPVALFLSRSDEALRIRSIDAMRYYGLSFAIVGINVVAAGYFTAIERPIYSLTISSARSFLLLSASLVVMSFLFGEHGIWLSTCVSEFFSLMITLFLFKRYRSEHTSSAFSFEPADES